MVLKKLGIIRGVVNELVTHYMELDLCVKEVITFNWTEM